MASIQATIGPIMNRLVQQQYIKLYVDHIEETARQLVPAAGIPKAELLRLLSAALIERADTLATRGIYDCKESE